MLAEGGVLSRQSRHSHLPHRAPLPCCCCRPNRACSLAVRSVCVRNVHPSASDRVLIAHFGTCGYIEDIDYLRWGGWLLGWVGGGWVGAQSQQAGQWQRHNQRHAWHVRPANS